MSEDQAPETPPADAANASAGIGDLVAGIIRDLQDIVRGEIRLAKAELKADATAAARGAGFLVGGAVVGLVGFLILMLAVAYLIAVWLPLWAATGIVASRSSPSPPASPCLASAGCPARVSRRS